MTEIITIAKNEIGKLSETQQGGHIRTADIRKLSLKLFKRIDDKSKDYVFQICHQLLEQRNWPMGIIAYDFAFRMKDQYDENTFTLFEYWLKEYVRGWGDCDDFCTHAFGELICQRTELVSHIIQWTTSDDFWMRRASAVILIPSIEQDRYNETNPLVISDLLMRDEHHLVLKGYGWMLKILSLKEPDLVFEYLQNNKEMMPRLSYRYALEKMSREKRKILMQK